MSNVKVTPSVVKLLELIKLNVPVTPAQIDEHMGGNYASKHICYLRKIGFEFDVTKDGRKIANYNLVAEPSNVDEIRGYVKPTKAAAPKKASAKKTAAKKTTKSEKKTDKEIKAVNLSKLKEVKQKTKKVIDIDEDEEDNLDMFHSASSYDLDSDWDSMEGLNLAKLI